MPTRCKDCPLHCKPLFQPQTDAETTFMQQFKRGELQVQAGTTLLLEGAASPQLYTVLKGLGLRYKTLEEGQRQVLNFAFPGDLLGLQSALMGEMSHSAVASTDMVLCVFDRGGLWDLFREQPGRGYDLTYLAAQEEHFLGDALATIGQRDALERMSWAILKLWRRAEALEMTEGDSVALPWRQQDLADALGLSLVHTNKTLARLKREGVITWQEGRLRMANRARLAELAMAEDGEIITRPLF